MNAKSSKSHLAFLVAIALKGLYGLVEIVFGILVAVAGPDRLYAFVLRFTTPELVVHPGDKFVIAIQNGAADLARVSGALAVFYLLVHGVLKAAIAYNLLRDRRWIFLPACLILGAFVIFLGMRAAEHHSLGVLGLALLDLVTLALVVNEWRNIRKAALPAAA
jgi:uncharacterized membrane protein